MEECKWKQSDRLQIYGIIIINCLEEFPMSGSKPRYSVLRKQGYRVIIVERHLVFCKINESEKMVIIYAVVDARREYRNLI